MEHYIFPAIFTPDKERGGYTVKYPDLPGCLTEGDSLEMARANAQEVLEGFLYYMEQDNDLIPNPSSPENIEMVPGTFIIPIDAWMDLMRDEMNNKVVRTNVTLPKWMKDAAEERHFNFSQLLQHAIKERLNIH